MDISEGVFATLCLLIMGAAVIGWAWESIYRVFRTSRSLGNVK